MFFKVPGLDQVPIHLEVDAHETFASVRSRLAEVTGVPASCLRVAHGLQEPAEHFNLHENGIEPETLLTVTFELSGGAKKRKKKQYTKPKKNKHKKKKVKLHVLRFYKVDTNAKLTRQRKICANCGPGVFMATHADRTYCGRCSVANVVVAATE